MASSSELASATGRREIGNIAVPLRTWGGFDGVVSTGQWAGFDPVDSDRDRVDLFKAGTEGDAPERLWDYMGFGPFANDTNMRIWLTGCMKSRDPVFVGFRDQATGRLGGMGSFMAIRPDAGVVELGNLWFGRAWQRDPRATEVLSLMMHHAMETLEYRRLEWKCNAFNAPSRSAALRLGFRYEGEFLNHLIVKGRSRDTAWFSITDEEWPRVRDAHTRWFAPENFDADGQQRKSLSDLTKALW